MNGTTLYLLLAIVIIGIIAIIIVKLYYKDNEKDTNIESLSELKNELFRKKRNPLNDPNSEFIAQHQSLSRKNTPSRNLNQSAYSLDKTESTGSISDIVVTQDKGVYTVENVMFNNDFVETIEPIHEEVEDESTGTVAILKEDETQLKEEIPEVEVPKDLENSDEVKVAEEKIPDNSDLKDLFTIDELIKESRRKDNELEKKNKGEDLEETKIKESISKSKDIANAINETEEDSDESDESLTPVEKINTIKKLLDKTSSEVQTESDLKEKAEQEEISQENENAEKIESPEIKEEISQEETNPDDEISVYKLKNTESEYIDEDFDLDYRKDLEKIKSVFKKSKIINNVKNKVNQERDYDKNDAFIKNVSSNENKTYGTDYNEPIIPKRRIEISGEENTRKVYNMAKNTSGEAKTESSLHASNSQNSIDFILNNEKTTLKKKDEIIFFVGEETYSSKVFDIRGEDIYVRYRGKNKIIKTSDIKKIY